MEHMEFFVLLLISMEVDPSQVLSRVIKHVQVTHFGKTVGLPLFLSYFSFLFSRDFRQAKLDLTSGRPVANPVVWSNVAIDFEVIRFCF